MNVVMLNSKSKNKASKNKGDDIIHVSPCHVICGSYPEEREEEERGHGGYGHGDGLGEPPGEHPGQDAQHVPAGGGRGPIHLDEETDKGA